MNGDLNALCNEALRVLFLAAIPVTVAGVIGGGIAALLQVVTSLQDQSFAYFFRLLACVLVGGVVCSSVVTALQDLLLRSLQ